MGAVIAATAISTDPEVKSSVDHAVLAAEECLAKAGVSRKEIDILISVGIYRDENIGEPAMAPLIQKRLGMNPIYDAGMSHKTFSFDLLNGSSGFLNAVQIIHSLFVNREIRYALVVSSEMHPSQKQVLDFPFTHHGAATLFAWSDDEARGFQKVFFRTSDDDRYGLEGYVDLLGYGPHARYNITIEADADYMARLKQFTVDSLRIFYRRLDDFSIVDLSKLKFLTSVPVRGFGEMVVRSISLLSNNPNPVICLHEKYGDPHSSALMIAYHEAAEEGSIAAGDQVLFVGAGSGITVGAALYFA